MKEVIKRMVENGHYVKRVQKEGESKEIKHSPFGLTPLQKWTCKK